VLATIITFVNLSKKKMHSKLLIAYAQKVLALLVFKQHMQLQEQVLLFHFYINKYVIVTISTDNLYVHNRQ
jgi:hypothetical protein